ncbi:MAG: penicillin-binding transpeptidase domain-containing protein [Micrococcus sp.]|nr:penicillin-binding transpeptidase domain-containing protein [Micrococcus sp.]
MSERSPRRGQAASGAARLPARAPRPSRLVRGVALGATAALLLSTTGCFGPSRPSPDDTAAALAEAIGNNDFSALDLTASSAGVPDQITEALGGLGDRPTHVSFPAATVDEDDPDRATARFTIGRTLRQGSDGSSGTHSDPAVGRVVWTYDTAADLVWDEEAQIWRVDLRPDDAVAGLAPGGTVRFHRTPGERGDILDAAGDPLMMERDVAVLGLDKAHIEPDQVADSARQVAELAEVDVEAFMARAEAAGDKAFVEAITLRADGSTGIPVDELARIPGGRVLEDTAVLAPTRTFARDVLGTYGEPSAEQVEASDGELRAGVEAGLSGLQADWEDHLAGAPGLAITIDNPEEPAGSGPGADGGGAAPSASAAPSRGGTAAGSPSGAAASFPDVTAFETEPVAGRDLASTLDRRIQAEAETVVEAAEVPAGLVAIRPSDGHVLAAASGPEGWPVAVSGSYAPGSTFKVVTTLALLRAGLDPEETVQCPATLNVGGMVVGNYDGYPNSSVGAIPFTEAFAESCNTVFVGAHEDISAADEAEAARALGLDPDPVTGLEAAFLGSVPDDSTGTEHAANLFGQGVVEASPLGMATVAASVAAGHTVRPVFVSDPAVDAPAPPETGVTEEEAAQLRSLMSGVVETGTAEMLQDVPGSPVLAKTGTAQFVADGEDLAHTWLIAIHGDLAVALFFNEGLGGGHDNGPVVRDFLTAVEGIVPSA